MPVADLVKRHLSDVRQSRWSRLVDWRLLGWMVVLLLAVYWKYESWTVASLAVLGMFMFGLGTGIVWVLCRILDEARKGVFEQRAAIKFAPMIAVFITIAFIFHEYLPTDLIMKLSFAFGSIPYIGYSFRPKTAVVLILALLAVIYFIVHYL